MGKTVRVFTLYLTIFCISSLYYLGFKINDGTPWPYIIWCSVWRNYIYEKFYTSPSPVHSVFFLFLVILMILASQFNTQFPSLTAKFNVWEVARMQCSKRAFSLRHSNVALSSIPRWPVECVVFVLRGLKDENVCQDTFMFNFHLAAMDKWRPLCLGSAQNSIGRQYKSTRLLQWKWRKDHGVDLGKNQCYEENARSMRSIRHHFFPRATLGRYEARE